MKNVYPIVLIPTETGYVVNIPDFNFMTQGEDIADAIDMARDAISLMGVQYEDKKQAIPQPSDISRVVCKDNEIVTLVDVDFSAYRKSMNHRAVRKNCTIPSWLNEQAEKANINFSQLLQKAIKEELHLV